MNGQKCGEIMKTEIIEKDYIKDLNKIKETIRTNQYKAMVVVNSTMIMTYYEIGTIINERKVWGNKYIEKLSNDLKEYGKGYSYEQLKRMSRIAKEFSINEIRSQLVTQISWSTLTTVILAKSKTHEEILCYIKQTHKHSWSRSMVLNQIKLKAYERSLIEPDTSPIITSSQDLTNELFKDTYVFDFIDINNIRSDLDSNTIGIVLCPEANGFVCKTTLMNTNNLAISKYKFINELPEYLEKRLKEVDE